MLTHQQVDILARGIFSQWAQPDRFKGVTFPPYNARTPRKQAPGDPQRGAQVYARYCAQCHGEGGDGGPHGGAIVDPSFLALVTDQALRTTVIAAGVSIWACQTGATTCPVNP